MGGVIGCNSTIYFRSRITSLKGGKIRIGNNSLIGRSSYQYFCGMPFYTSIFLDGDENTFVSIGSRCRINGVYIHAKSQIAIGDNCVMASGINIIDSNGHELYSNDRTNGGADKPVPITIGNNVWIGVNSTILKGSTISDNCVVAAGSVVKGCFPNNSLIAGNPAKVIKHLEIISDDLYETV